MFQFSQSPFLQALGYTIVNSLWQFAFLWLIYLAINCIISLSAHKKYAAAVSLQLAGFAWFIITFIFYYNKCIYLANTGSEFNGGLVSFGQMSYTGSLKDRMLLGILRTEVFLPYLSVAYLIIFFFLIVKWIEAFRFSKALQVTGLEKIDFPYRLFVNKLSYQLGLKRSVRVFLSHYVKSPLTVGFFKPIILLPFASLNNLSCDQVEAVLLHELAHIKRSDYLINLLLSVIEVALFFNPFMQILSRHIKRERENSCDDWVLQFEYNASNYAKALLSLATIERNPVSTLTMNAVDQKQSLLIRVKRMIEKKDRTFNYRNQLITLLALAGLMSVMAWITPRSKQQNLAPVINQNQLFVPEPMVAKIDNPFFNPVFFLAEKTRTMHPVAVQILPNNVSKEVSVLQIALPAFTMHVQEETINKASAEATALAIDAEEILPAVALANNEVDIPIAFKVKTNEPNLENFDDQLSKLDYQVKEVETYLKQLSINTLESVHKNNQAKQEVRKALKSLKASISITTKNTNQNKLLHIRSLHDSAEAYFKKIFNEKTLAAINDQLDAQLQGVAAQREATTQYNNWKAQDKAEVMIYAPYMEPAQTFSYDYREYPKATTGVKKNEQQANDPGNDNGEIDGSPDEVIEIHIVFSAKGENKKVKKIIKRTRI